MEEMGRKRVELSGIGTEIDEILRGYVKAQSFTYTKREKEAEGFFVDYFSKLPYYEKHPDYFGTWNIPEDVFGRAVSFAMVKGGGDDTVVFVHHNDVVGVEDFKQLADLAFSPDELAAELEKISDTLLPEARADLESGAYMFGRGVCDMKGGGAIQMALLKRYGELLEREGEDALPGNLVVIAVPDEENLSAGMRAGVRLLARLREKHGLNYRLMINSEPHQRKDPQRGVFSEGSVGKIMPFVYVRGFLAHVGKVFEGFNPLNLMSCIVRKTELATEFSDVVGKEAAPPPTWLYLKDGKSHYDVSMPLSISGCFSILTLNQTPGSVLEKVRAVCLEAFEEIVEEMNQRYRRFLTVTGQPLKKLPWEPKVVAFAQLVEEAKTGHNQGFEEAYGKKLTELGAAVEENRLSLMESHIALVDFIYDYIDDLSPRVVYGLMPPYYPNVTNAFLDPKLRRGGVEGLSESLAEFTRRTYGQDYDKEAFYTGISDLSYTSISNSGEIEKALRSAMPFFGVTYDIPAEVIETLSMPCINIGPWGKDFHKLTERVLKEDLLERTPRIIEEAIRLVLG